MNQDEAAKEAAADAKSASTAQDHKPLTPEVVEMQREMARELAKSPKLAKKAVQAI